MESFRGTASGAVDQPCCWPPGEEVVWLYDGKPGVIGVVSPVYEPQEPCFALEELLASAAIQALWLPYSGYAARFIEPGATESLVSMGYQSRRMETSEEDRLTLQVRRVSQGHVLDGRHGHVAMLLCRVNVDWMPSLYGGGGRRGRRRKSMSRRRSRNRCVPRVWRALGGHGLVLAVLVQLLASLALCLTRRPGLTADLPTSTACCIIKDIIRTSTTSQREAFNSDHDPVLGDRVKRGVRVLAYCRLSMHDGSSACFASFLQRWPSSLRRRRMLADPF